MESDEGEVRSDAGIGRGRLHSGDALHGVNHDAGEGDSVEESDESGEEEMDEESYGSED